MTLERLQCPSCGGAVTPEGREQFFCSFCGAKLRRKVGSSGNPMAVLDRIKDDTSLLARRSAQVELRTKVDALSRERADLQARRDREIAGLGKGCTLEWPLVVFLPICAAGVLLSGSQPVLSLILMVLSVVVLMGLKIINISRDSEKAERAAQLRREVVDRWNAQIELVESKIHELKQQMAANQEEIDRLVGQM